MNKVSESDSLLILLNSCKELIIYIIEEESEVIWRAL